MYIQDWKDRFDVCFEDFIVNKEFGELKEHLFDYIESEINKTREDMKYKIIYYLPDDESDYSKQMAKEFIENL